MVLSVIFFAKREKKRRISLFEIHIHKQKIKNKNKENRRQQIHKNRIERNIIDLFFFLPDNDCHSREREREILFLIYTQGILAKTGD